MSNDTRQVCGWVGGRICHLSPNHSGEHSTVDGPTADALEVQALDATVEDELHDEWQGLWQRLWALDPKLAREIDDNVGARAAEDLRPLIEGLRAIATMAATVPAEQALPAIQATALELVEHYDPSL